MAVDQQTRQDQQELDSLHDVTGIDPAEARAMEDRAITDDMAERNKLDDSTGDNEIPFKNDTKKKRRLSALINRKSGTIALGGGGILVSIAIFVSVTLPGFVITNLRELIMNNISNLQTNQTTRYRRSKLARVSDAFSRDGRLGSKIMAEMGAEGYTFHFGDPNDNNKITGMTLPGGNRSIPNIAGTDALSAHLHDYMEVKHPLRTSRWKTKRMDAFYTRYGVSRVSVVNQAIPDADTPERTVNKAVAGSIMEDDYDPTTSSSDLPEDATEEQRARRTELEETAQNNGMFDDMKEELVENGTPIDEMTDELANVADDIGEGISPDLHTVANSIASGQSIGGRALGGIKGLSVGDLADKVCTVKNRLRTAVTAARSVRALGMLRYAAVFIGASDEIRTGKADSKLINELMKRVTTNDKNGNPIGASPGFAYALKGKFSKSKNDVFKSSYAVDGKLTGAYGTIQDTTGKIPLTSSRSCGVWQNPVTQVGIGIVEIGLAVFTGGGSGALSVGAKQGVTQAMKTFFQSITARQIAKSLVFTAAAELTFEGIMTLTQMYAEKSLAMNFTGQEAGGQLGGIITGGGGTLNKQRGLQSGMVPATTEQYSLALQENNEYKNEQRKGQSFYARILDMNNPDSLAFSTMSSLALSTPSGVAAIPHFASKSVGTLGEIFSTKTLFGAFSSSVSAQDTDEVSFDTYTTEGNNNNIDLAVDHAGNTLVTLPQEIADMDPEENIQYLVSDNQIDSTTYEPVADSQFANHIVNCVEQIDIISMIEGGDSSDPAQDCMATQAKTKRFKAHLAYLDMVDGLEAHFFPEEIEEGATTETPTTTSNGERVVGNTSSTPCAAGTTDLGESDGYNGGQMYKIRLCGIPGFTSRGGEDTQGIIRVNSTVSGNWLNLFNQAKQNGISLSANSSFRSMASQEALWDRYQRGVGNEAARPGYSNHQMGFAVDVDIVPGASDPSLTTCQANPPAYPVYQFLAGAAPALGITAGVQSECWHWANEG